MRSCPILVTLAVLGMLGGTVPPPLAAQDRPSPPPADVEFMQGMIVHHDQALQMAALAPERAGSESLRTLARRIDVSQRDEIAMMRQWLVRRGQSVAAADHVAHGATDHPGMPGMASAEEMARLRGLRGAAFDRLFLELMIRHHEGALTMVKELLSTDGAGQEPELYRFASDVDTDQRMEIARMQRLLTNPPQ